MMQVFEALIGFRPGKGNYFSQYGIFQAVCVHLYLSFTQLEKKKKFFLFYVIVSFSALCIYLYFLAPVYFIVSILH